MPLRIESYDEPAAGVAIEREGAARPVFVLPFPKDRLHRAEALDDDTVLFIGGSAGPDLRHNALLLAVYDLRAGSFTHRAAFDGLAGHQRHVLSPDRRRLLVGGSGVTVIDAFTLALLKRYDRYKIDGETGSAAAGLLDDAGREGWARIFLLHAHQFGDLGDGRIMLVEEMPVRSPPTGYPLVQRALTVDLASDEVQVRVLLRTDGAGPLGRVDPRADLAFVSSRQVALFHGLAPLPETTGVEGVWSGDGAAAECAAPDAPAYGLALHVWRLADPESLPITVIVRSEPPARWKQACATNYVPGFGSTISRDDVERMLDAQPAGACAADDALWCLAAQAFVYRIVEDPRDGTIWIAFADDHLRSIGVDGRLGPLIRLGGEPSRMYGPSLTFEADGTITVMRFPQSGPGLHSFDPRHLDGVAGPITIEPVEIHPSPNRHERAFAAFAKRQTRRRFTVPDWTREACASALVKQASTLRGGLGSMVVASTGRLNFTYRVGKSTLDEAAFFAGLVERELPVVPELRALLRAYLDALGEGGEGEQPWEDPDEAIAALGSALRALALLDPGSLDLVRAYLEARDGEHEGYALDVVVPAYFERHGWRSAEAVRFGIYATLNRFWGGRRPVRGFDGMNHAMAVLSTPEDVAETVRREAEAFGRKGDWGYGAGEYRNAFRSILDPSVTYEAAVLNALREDGDPS